LKNNVMNFHIFLGLLFLTIKLNFSILKSRISYSNKYRSAKFSLIYI
jgi:hypothetical protein